MLFLFGFAACDNAKTTDTGETEDVELVQGVANSGAVKRRADRLWRY